MSTDNNVEKQSQKNSTRNIKKPNDTRKSNHSSDSSDVVYPKQTKGNNIRKKTPHHGKRRPYPRVKTSGGATNEQQVKNNKNSNAQNPSDHKEKKISANQSDIKKDYDNKKSNKQIDMTQKHKNEQNKNIIAPVSNETSDNDIKSRKSWLKRLLK